MGVCTSNALCGLDAKDHHVRTRIRLERAGIFDNRIARTRRVAVDGRTPTSTPENIQDASEIGQESVPSNDFNRVNWIGSSTSNGTSESKESKESRESGSNSFVSSTESDSFDSAEALNCLSMQGKDRYEIALEQVKAQIHHGADPKTLITLGDRSCLMVAVMGNDFSFTKELVEGGVDVNHSNSSGESALSLAIDMQRKDIAQYLRSKGAVLH